MSENQLPAVAPAATDVATQETTEGKPLDAAQILYGGDGVSERTKGAAPAAYALRLPEGTFVDKPLLTEFTKWARESNFTTQQAQRAADLNLKSIAANHRQLQAESQAQVKKWGDEVRNDRELGGANLPETIAAAEKLFTLAATIPGVNLTRFKNDLVRTGMANHPDLIRIARHVGLNFAD